MKIKKIVVSKLFNTFNHQIEFKEGDITLVLGQNGIGKTIILKMLHSFFNRDFTFFMNIDFDYYKIFLEKNYSILITSKFKENGVEIIAFLMEEEIEITSFKIYNSAEYNALIKRYLPFYVTQTAVNQWYDDRREIYYNLKQLAARFFPSSVIRKLEGIDVNIPEKMLKIISEIKISIVETQRLLIVSDLRQDEKQITHAVAKIAEDISNRIKSKLVESTQLASNLDSSYPKRLIQGVHLNKEVNLENVMKDLINLSIKREELGSVGLLMDKEKSENLLDTSLIRFFDKTLIHVLSLYVKDSYEKLGIFKELSEKINLFKEIINKRFLLKEIRINREKGIICNSTATNQDIPLSGLSSGEQHEIVLIHNLLFNVEANTLLLIDEPEISLHIKWQNEFINDLKKILELTQIQILIATHSPDIIGNNWNLTEELLPYS